MPPAKNTRTPLSFNTLVDLFNSGNYAQPFSEGNKVFQYRLYLKPNRMTPEIDLGVIEKVTADSLIFNSYSVYCYAGDKQIRVIDRDNTSQYYKLDSSVAQQAPVFIEKKEKLPISLSGGKSKKKRRCKSKRTRCQRSR